MEYVIEETKTEAGKRKLPITEDVADMFTYFYHQVIIRLGTIYECNYIYCLYYKLNEMIENQYLWEVLRIDKDTIRLPRQHMSLTYGRVRTKRYGS